MVEFECFNYIQHVISQKEMHHASTYLFFYFKLYTGKEVILLFVLDICRGVKSRLSIFISFDFNKIIPSQTILEYTICVSWEGPDLLKRLKLPIYADLNVIKLPSIRVSIGKT